MLRRCFILTLALCACGFSPAFGEDTGQEEASRLAKLLNWQAGSVVAEIGAGSGKLTLLAAERVGPSGRVYSTELDKNLFAHLQELAAKDPHISAVQAAVADTNLPPGCCDSIFMRLVYHHLTKPGEIDASLLRSLKPGGRLAVIDEEPFEGSSIPEGVPKNRVGHGIPHKVLIDELTAAGFELGEVHDDWPGRDTYHQMYCVIFSKPKP